MTCEPQSPSTHAEPSAGGALVVFMPAVLYPLIDAATHIVQAERIWLKAADLDRLLGGGDVGAILTIGHARLRLIAPPVPRLRACPRSVFPFSLGRQAVPMCAFIGDS